MSDDETAVDPNGERVGSAKERTTRTEDILAEAHARDDRADSRDVVADERDRTASLQSFLSDDRYDDTGHKARRAAAMDRSDSKDDRTSAEADRSELAGEAPLS